MVVTEYSSMKVDELKREIRRRGLDLPAKAKKADLVAVLEQADLETPIEVEAVTMETDLVPAGALDIDMQAVQQAAITLTETIEQATTALDQYAVDDETLETMTAADLRICEDGLAAAIKSVDDKRLELTRMLTAPKKAIDTRCKELVEPLKELAARYAETREGMLEQGFRNQYAYSCETYGMTQLAEVVPYEQFIAMHPRWTGRTANPVRTQEKIADEVARIAEDWRTLQSLRGGMRHYDDAEAEFWRTLDVKAAIERNNSRDQEQANVERMRAEQAENEAWKAEHEVARDYVAEAAFEEVPERTEPVRQQYRFTVWLSSAEVTALREWKNSTGIGREWLFKEV